MSVATIGAVDYAKALDGLSLRQAQLMLTTQGIVGEEQRHMLIQQGLIASSDRMSASLVAEALANSGLNKEKQEELLTDLGLMNQKTKELITENAITEAKLRTILAEKGIKGAKADTLVASILQTGQNAKEAISWDVLSTSIKKSMIALAKNPLTWISVAIGTITGLVKGFDSLIGKQEKLARTNLVGLNEDLSIYDEEINSLEELQEKLVTAKGNQSELAKIQNELNDTIGETAGLLNGEGKAYEIANAKLKANIELKKQQRQQAVKEKVSASKDLFNTNVYERDGLFKLDYTGNMMQNYAKQYQTFIDAYDSLSDKQKDFYKDANTFALARLKGMGVDVNGWSDYWNEQVQTAYDVFDEVIQDYDGVGGQSFIKNIIDTAVRSGSDLSEISNIINQVVDNQELQNNINSYWESLVNPDIDSENAKTNVEESIRDITDTYPQLKTFFTEFYEGIVSGAKTVTDIVEDTNNRFEDSRTKMISSINDTSEGFESLDKIFSSIKDSELFNFKLLDDENFKETFGELNEYADFIKQITSNSDDIDVCRSAFNDLVTEWLNHTGILNNLTEENKNLTVSMLKQMGVTNAEEIVLSRLNAQKEASVAIGKDFADITEEDIEKLIAEGNVSATTCQYLSQLRLAKLDVNKLQLDTKGDIDNILAIANAAGASIAQIYTLKIALENLQSTKTASLNALKKDVSIYNNPIQNQEALKQHKTSIEDQLKQAQNQVQDALNSIQNSAKLNASDFYADYNGGSSSNKESGSDAKESFNWIETALSRAQRAVSNFGKTVAATWQSWKERNAALKKQMSAIRNEISLQDQAYSKYMALADSVGLSEGYKTLVREGSINIETIESESIAEAIKLYQEYYEKALAAKDASADLKDELAALAQTKFSNLAQSFADLMSGNEHSISMYEATIDLMEKRGYTASASLYDSLKQAESDNQGILKEKYQSLSQALDEAVSSGAVVKYSEQWYQMQNEILAVEEAIIQSNIALAEYDNSLRDLEWGAFDKLHEEISEIYEETEFLDKLLSDEKKFNEDGSLTDSGQAALGLDVVNYKMHRAQAKEYAQELERIKEELAKDPYNQDLLDHQDELEEKHREVLTQIEDNEQSMIDKVSEGYDTLLDYMDQMIDKRKNMLSQAKDLYEYEKNISKQTQDIASLEKQLAAYQGDDSEEARATIQKLQVSLSEAKENLEETEYEKYISDQEEMLDTLRLQTEEWINRRLDNEDQLLKDIVSSTERNATSIKETLSKATSDAGTTLSSAMTSIWSSDGEIGSAITQIKDYLAGMQKNAEEKAKEQVQNNTSASSDSGSTPATAPTSFTPPTTSAPKWGDFFIKKYDSHTKNELNTETSIVDRLKYFDIDSDFKARKTYYTAMGGSGIYTGSYAQNSWMISQMKANGYARGGFIGDMIRAAGEDGIALVRRGEGIIPTNMVPEWNALIHHLPQLNNSMLGSIPQHETNVSIDIGDIQMYGVNDPEAFAHQLKQAMLNNNSIRNIMKDTTIGEALGRNSMTRYTR